MKIALAFYFILQLFCSSRAILFAGRERSFSILLPAGPTRNYLLLAATLAFALRCSGRDTPRSTLAVVAAVARFLGIACAYSHLP